MPRLFIGIHTHRHGVTPYLFQTGAGGMSTDDFAAHLGDEFEPDREDEFLDLSEETPILLEGAA